MAYPSVRDGWTQITGAVPVNINEHMAQTKQNNTLNTLVRSMWFCARQNIALRQREVWINNLKDNFGDSDASNEEGQEN